MFDKLIESNSAAADFRIRRKYFVMSALVVGCLFLAGVVASIYASDIGLGTDEFELAAMLTPVNPPQNRPEPPKERQQTQQNMQRSELPSRQSNMLRPEESPTEIPPISTARPSQLSRPIGDFAISDRPETVGPPVAPNSDTAGTPSGSGGSYQPESRASEKPVIPEPPAIKEPPPAPKPAVPTTLGVVNGSATYLPKPPYPAAAVAVNAQGKVSVQVTIDEDGRVVSARAVDGHPLLRGVAEAAAKQAKFSPTLLSKVPVKVTGVIVYNFTRN